MSNGQGEARSGGDAPLRGPAAALLLAPNPWSAWMADWEVERLSWMHLAAMLLCDVPIHMVANRLAAGFAVLQAGHESVVMELFEDDLDPEDGEVDWAFWLGRWRMENYPIYGELVRGIDHELLASYGAALEPSRTSCEENGKVCVEALLWFFLVAIRGWAERSDDHSAVKPGARWILELHRGDRAEADPIAALLAYLYDRFRAGGYAPTAPLPALLEIDRPFMTRGLQRRRENTATH